MEYHKQHCREGRHAQKGSMMGHAWLELITADALDWCSSGLVGACEPRVASLVVILLMPVGGGNPHASHIL